MKLLIPLCCIIFFPYRAPAQQINKSISGYVKDIENEPVPAATIRLLNGIDSMLVQSKTARDNGKFEFTNVPNGMYLLTVSAVGNKQFTSSPFTIDDHHPGLVIPVIILQPARKTELKEVVVTSKRPLIEQDIDKTIVNVEAMISSAGSNTLEVLEKTPGVTIGTDGQILLNGISGVLVLIDGRPTYMSGQDLAAYLKSLPGSLLDKIELMTNPPAKYDAAGNAIINIRLKRNKVQGYNGNLSLNYSQGIAGRSYNSLNLNYLKKKFNYFATFSFGKDGNSNDDYSARVFFNNNNEKNLSVNLKNHSVYRSTDYSGRFGLDYFLSSKTTVGFMATTSYRPKTDRMNYYSSSYGGDDILDSAGSGYSAGRYTWKELGMNLNFLHKFNTEGSELSADLNFINYKSSGNQELQNFVTRSSGTPVSNYSFLYNLPATISILTGKADYTYPLKNKLTLSGGIKSGMVTNDNNSAYFNIVDNSNNPDYGKSNHFIYRENINAVYINSRKDWKKIGAQVGLRLENTNTSGNQSGNVIVRGTTFHRHYTGLFPTAFINYKLDSLGKHSLTLSFSRRLNRPNYQQLNPFLYFRDQYSYVSGNPDLMPSFGSRVELGYRHKQWLGITVQYDRIAKNFFDATRDSGTIFVSRPENIANGHMFALLANLTLSPVKWWNISLNLGTAHFVNRAMIYAESLDLQINAFRANILNQIRFKKDWSGEVSANYITRIIAWQRILEPRYRLNAALQKKILKGKASVKLTAEDIFHTWQQKFKTVGIKNASSYQSNIQDSRRLGLAVNFNFGKETFARKRKNTGNAADDEKGRVE